MYSTLMNCTKFSKQFKMNQYSQLATILQQSAHIISCILILVHRHKEC